MKIAFIICLNAQGGGGYAESIVFQNIDMHNVQNPIIIDQNYCDSKDPCPEQVNDPDTLLCFFFFLFLILSHCQAAKNSLEWFQKDAVAISRVVYKNIKGTSASDVSMKFSCSKSLPCHGIVLQDINLVGEDGNSTKSSCNHVNWTGSGGVVPTPCEKKIWKIIPKKLLCLYILTLFDQIFIYDYLVNIGYD